jgi:hypothetical protein
MGALYRGQVRRHGRIMRSLYGQGLIVAGVFTFLPGRRMNGVLFFKAPWVGFAGVVVVGPVTATCIWQDGKRMEAQNGPSHRRWASLNTRRPSHIVRIWRNW